MEAYNDDESHASAVHFSNHTHSHIHYHYSVTVTAASAALINKPTFRVYTKANPGFCLTIRDGNLVVAKSDPNNKDQYWYRVDDYNSLVKDKDGSPAFSLVNKVTGLAIKHSTGVNHPVRLVPYRPLSLDQSILWTESMRCFDGFKAFRLVNNTNINLDIFGHGKVEDGTAIIMSRWKDCDRQKWAFCAAE
ncbi:hypothetical protein RIF29_35037 [Crotalaria pallida]|uniref:Uncharacterized protein n=1 Tax=Crotalaria pallida TaxID=3830 RepID=A0AAN9EAR0_CROPI